MVALEERFEWLKEILSEKPDCYRDYFKDDIANYLGIESLEAIDLIDLFDKKHNKFLFCKSKEDVRDFVSDVTGFVVMKLDVEAIIADYFS